jgi:hypothetical protein
MKKITLYVLVEQQRPTTQFRYDGETSAGVGHSAAAGGFEPVPVNAGTMPHQVLQAFASKESGPPA